MAKISKMPSGAGKKEKLQALVNALEELKDNAVEVLDTFEESDEEPEVLDGLTDALDALEDAYEILNDILMDVN